MKVLVINRNSFNFKDKKDGREVAGTKINYIELNGIEHTEYKEGYNLASYSKAVPNDQDLKQIKAPAIYELRFEGKPGAYGKAVLELIEANFIEDYKI